MNKYVLKIMKVEELTEDNNPLRGQFPQEIEIFSGKMDSDATVEILNHVYQLKNK